MADDGARMPLKLDERLERAFADAARRDDVAPTQALHDLVEGYVRQSLRKEARRQCGLVARAPDSAETEALMLDAQDLDGD